MKKNKNLTVGFAGPFGDTNFGDYAMLVNDIYYIGANKNIVFSYNGKLTDLLGQSYLKEKKAVNFVVDMLYDFEIKYSNTYTITFDDKALTPLEILELVKNVDDLRKQMEEIDVLFVCGGGYFNRIWSAKHRKGKLLSVLATILIADELQKKVVFGGNSFGPFDQSSEFFSAFFSVLRNVQYASRDDLYSVSNLRKIGIDDQVFIVPDDLYFVEKELSEKVSEFRDKLPKQYLLLELYSSIDELAEEMDELRAFVQNIKNKYNLEVLFVPLDKMYGGEKQGEFLKKEINDIIYLDFRGNDFRKIEDVEEIVRNAKFVLCQRYHMFVIAIANNIPAMHIQKHVCGDLRYYYSKTAGLLRQVFRSQSIQQDIFMANKLSLALNQTDEHLLELVDKQKVYFNRKKMVDEDEMMKRRNIYMNENILYDCNQKE